MTQHTYYYPDHEKGVPVKIVASLKSEARKKARSMGLPAREVGSNWKSLGKRGGGSLEGTMSTSAKETETPSLPLEEMGETSLLQAALSGVTRKAYKEGLSGAKKGVESKLGEMGLGAEETKPIGSSDIINFVESRVREPVEKSFETASFLVSELEKHKEDERVRAIDNLNTLISSTGALGRMFNNNRSQLRTLADKAEIDMSLLEAIKGTQEANIKTENILNPGALFKDQITEKEYDLLTVRGLKDYKNDYPGSVWADMQALLDKVTKVDKSTRDVLLRSAGYEMPEEKTLTLEEWRKNLREKFKAYKDRGYSLDEVVEKWKSENETDKIPKNIWKELREVYGTWKESPEDWWKYW